MLSRAALPLRQSLRVPAIRTLTTTSSCNAINRKPPSTSAADLHDLPQSVKTAAKPSSSASASPDRLDASGNSTAPEALSSRPTAPGPSGPSIDPAVAAPGQVSRDGSNGDGGAQENWTTSFAGMSEKPFDGNAAEVLGQELNPEDVEIKPDGLIYLPEIKYRRILTRAFGPGGWGMAPRGETNVGPKVVSREWVLVCLGRFVSTARGEQEYFDPNGIATASEAAKSNALMRCCKDLGIASELWDPRFIREFKKKHCVEVFVEDAKSGRKRKLWRRKDSPPFEYPFKESK
ncbi:unnamed protein product [Sympodiomycopsis kandeliae]